MNDVALLGALDPRRLHLLLELSRLGSMQEVAAEHGLTTSTVSQQLARLSRDVGTALLEPAGRRVRLTPAGLRLAGRAVDLLAVAEAARADLDPHAEPTGTVRAAGFASGVRRGLLPAVRSLTTKHPDVRCVVSELEPAEALARLDDDDIDVALVYDYNLAPLAVPSHVRAVRLWSSPWGLVVPAVDPVDAVDPLDKDGTTPATDLDDPVASLRSWSRHPWIVNSRNDADEEAMRTLARLHGLTPTFAHRIDSLELLEEVVLAGLGVGLLPRDREHHPGVRVLRLPEPGVLDVAYAVVRRGREAWAPVAALLAELETAAQHPDPGERR